MRTGHFIIKTIGDLRVRITPECDSHDLRRFLALNLDRLRGQTGVTAVTDEDHATVLRLDRGAATPAFYWKEFRSRHWYDGLRDRWRGSKAARAWDGSLKLQRIGIFTARLVAYGEGPRRGLNHIRSFLITEEIEGAQTVWDFLKTFPDRPTHEQVVRKRHLMRELGRTAGRIHQAELHHREMLLNNILWKTGVSGRPRLYLIDTDRVERGMPISEHDVIRNLVQLNSFYFPAFTITDRARMLTAYADERVLDAATRRSFSDRMFDRLRDRLRRRLGKIEQEDLPQKFVEGMKHMLQLLTPPADAKQGRSAVQTTK